MLYNIQYEYYLLFAFNRSSITLDSVIREVNKTILILIFPMAYFSVMLIGIIYPTALYVL